MADGNIFVSWRDAAQVFKNPAQPQAEEIKSRFHTYLARDTCSTDDPGQHVCSESERTVFPDGRLPVESMTDIPCVFE